MCKQSVETVRSKELSLIRPSAIFKLVPSRDFKRQLVRKIKKTLEEIDLSSEDFDSLETRMNSESMVGGEPALSD